MAEMVWTAETLWNEQIRRCGVVDIAEKMRVARLRWNEWLRWYGRPRHYGMNRSEDVGW
jgi:hypothetical protein